jgi:glyoxylate utilization-related uncharacterized protein
MPKASREQAQVQVFGPVEDRHEDLDGYTVNFVSFGADVDAGPLLRGLPDDRCSCPHWGYVVKGRMSVRFADREEVYEAGDAFYMPPGHVPAVAAGTEIVQFSPTEPLREVEATMARNMQAMQGV